MGQGAGGAREQPVWQAEQDYDYGQALLRFYFWRLRWWLLTTALAGATLSGVIALCTVSVYSSSATLLVGKKGAVSPGLSTAASLLGLGGGDSQLQNEMELLQSRNLAQQVIDAEGLAADVFDPRNPDTVTGRLRKLFQLDKGLTREERFERLRVSNVEFNPDVLEKVRLVVQADKEGWRCAGKRGKHGTAVQAKGVSFVPHFGKGNHPGFRYVVELRPPGQAFVKFRERLSVTLTDDNASIIQVKFRHHNPYVCQATVEQLIESYLAQYQQRLTGDFDSLLNFVSAEQRATTGKLQAALEEQKRFQEQQGVFAPDSQGEELIRSIGSIRQQQLTLDVQRRQAQSLLGLLNGGTSDALAAAVRSPAYTALEGEQGELFRLVRQLEEERQSKTEEHPDVKGLLESIGHARDQLRQTTQAHLRSLDDGLSEMQSRLQHDEQQLNSLPGAAGKLLQLRVEIESATEILALLKRTEAETNLQKQQVERDVRLVDSPLTPGKRESPRVGRSAALGAALGGMAALAAGLLLGGGGRRLSSLRELRQALGLRVLAVFRAGSRRQGWRPAAPDEEARKLAQRLLRWLGSQPRSSADGLLLAVVHYGDQPSFELAWALSAASEQPCLLVETDNVDGALRKAAAIAPTQPGLAELLAGDSTLEAALRAQPDGPVLLTAGRGPLLSGESEWSALLAGLRQRFGLVVLCLPPAQRWPDSLPLLQAADQLLLSLPQRGFSRDELRLDLAEIEHRGFTVTGAVVTGYDPREDSLGAGELRFVTLSSES